MQQPFATTDRSDTMTHTYYRIPTPALRAKSLRIAQVSDVHFSRSTGHGKNMRTIAELCESMQFLRPDVIAVTGDLVSRDTGPETIVDAVKCLNELRNFAPVLYTYGNHEADLSPEKLHKLTKAAQSADITLLNNRTITVGGANFSGFVLPYDCYKNNTGGYSQLRECTAQDIYGALGIREKTATVLLAHSPMGLAAYAQWGADVVLSGHVHGGIVRMPVLGGILSPERKFFPEYSKGQYHMKRTEMIVSAGIGKLRFGNPSEVVCVDLFLEQGR